MGGALLVEDANMTGPALLKIVNDLIDHPQRLADLSAGAVALARPDAASAIAELVEMHARER